MTTNPTVREVLSWRGGQTDLWPLLAEPELLNSVVRTMAEPHQGLVDLVAGPDPGGLLFGPMVAHRLRVPFAPVCRDRDYFFQGPHQTVCDHTAGSQLLMHRAALTDRTRVLIVDDWSETGGTITRVCNMILAAGASVSAVSFLVDSLPTATRKHLHEAGVAVHAVMDAPESA